METKILRDEILFYKLSFCAILKTSPYKKLLRLKNIDSLKPNEWVKLYFVIL